LATALETFLFGRPIAFVDVVASADDLLFALLFLDCREGLHVVSLAGVALEKLLQVGGSRLLRFRHRCHLTGRYFCVLRRQRVGRWGRRSDWRWAAGICLSKHLQ
jgi:hypothetical protein